jgi:hypothetical protein
MAARVVEDDVSQKALPGREVVAAGRALEPGPERLAVAVGA